MKRRNLIGSLLARLGVMFTGTPRGAAAGSPMGPRLRGDDNGGGDDMDSRLRGNDSEEDAATGTSTTATVRLIYANATQASWEAVTNGGILVAGATPITVAGDLNLQIIRDAAKAIVAAGGPRLGRQNIVLFGGQA